MRLGEGVWVDLPPPLRQVTNISIVFYKANELILKLIPKDKKPQNLLILKDIQVQNMCSISIYKKS